jgi:hypothetical protein
MRRVRYEQGVETRMVWGGGGGRSGNEEGLGDEYGVVMRRRWGDEDGVVTRMAWH